MNLENEGRMEGEFGRDVLSALKMAYGAFISRILLTLIVGFLGRALLLGNTNLIGIWVDSLCVGTEICKPVPPLFQGWGSDDFLNLLIVCVVAGFFLTWIYRVAFSRLSARAVSQLYDETTFRASRFPMRFFDTTPVGRVVTRFSSDYGNVFRLFGGPLAEFLSIMFDLACMIILVTLASPYYLPVILVYILANYVVYLRNREEMRRQRRDMSASRSPSVSHFAETAQGAPTIRSFNRESIFQQRFARLDGYYLDQKIKTVKTVMLFSWQMNSLTALLLFVTGLLSWWLLSTGHLSLGAIGVAFGLITLSGNTVLMFFEWLAQVEEALIGVERLNQYLRAPIEPGAALPHAAHFPTGHPREPAARALAQENAVADGLLAERALSVEFDHVRFRYDSSLPWVLNDLSFHIRPGEKIGVIGRTGGGKSSLIQALLQLYAVEGGEVRVGGIPMARVHGGPGLPLAAARRLFAYIPQDPTLFRGRLRDNLDFERLLPDDEIFQTLKQVGLSEWATPAGLNLIIEERGRNLSLGEKQLLCLARAVLQKAPILIMDEATSSIDPQSEEKLTAATDKLFRERTQILIAHRLTTLESCDRIFWLKDGRLFAEGTPAEILPRFEKSDYPAPGPVLTSGHGAQDPTTN
ncbi:MAG: ABC transporter ATP-binding protein [Bdellovibrionaceae bacterium]|nr:ABC transporter ATP-binding protein [Pseudobdellovibrionaceae bacterium]